MSKTDETVKAEEKAETPTPETETETPKAKTKKVSGKKTAAKKPVKEKTVKKSAKGKVEKPAKEKAAKKSAKEKAPKKPAAERDTFGFRKGSKKSEAAKLYALKKGSTLAEVKEKTGSSQLNLLNELEGKGYTIEKTKVAGTGKKQVTRYKIVMPEKKTAA